MNKSNERNIKIAVVKGSIRPGNYTSKALSLVIDELYKNDDVTLSVIDPAELDLPFPGLPSNSKDPEKIKELVINSTGLVFSTPEYHGGYSSVIKLVIENLGFPSVLSGKPISLIGVAACQIGAIKALENLRGVLSHVGAIVLPGTVSVSGVQSLFDEDGNCKDKRIEKRIRSVATNLIHYIENNICPRISLEAMVRNMD